MPVIAVIACGAIDLAAVNADRNAMQDAADATALSAAKQLTMAADITGVQERSKSFAQGQLKASAALTYTVKTDVEADHSSVTVTLAGVRTSFFGNMLPPGGWKIKATATAAPMGRRPLCVLNAGTTKDFQFKMAGNAQIIAGKCLIHSNSDVEVTNNAWMQAAAVQVAGNASGHITPTAQIGAPSISDPFVDMKMSPPGILCMPLDLIFPLGITILAPGIHCGNLTAAKGATVQLLPGEHYFLRGKMKLNENAILRGTDVVMVFDDKSDFAFSDGSQIRLQGRRTGKYAGFVIATTRTNTNTFEISSDSARELLGTIYVPQATLKILGENNRVADQSAWTVIVAKSIEITGSANLVINADYAGSSVPVPTGVGPSVDQVVLKH